MIFIFLFNMTKYDDITFNLYPLKIKQYDLLDFMRNLNKIK